MATLWRGEGVRVFVPSRDHRDPPHVHVEYADCHSKWELQGMACAEHSGCSAGNLKKIRAILVQEEQAILRAWHEHWRSQNPGT